jgi:hypothetical protein
MAIGSFWRVAGNKGGKSHHISAGLFAFDSGRRRMLEKKKILHFLLDVEDMYRVRLWCQV